LHSWQEGNPPRSVDDSASKAGVVALTKPQGKGQATSGLLVNAIAPRVFDTPILGAQDETLMNSVKQKIPMNRVGLPEEAAELIAWLASDKVGFSTGFTYDLSGGRATY
jgi:3-oxoacyl-[acyl-carrier protein] reductase